MRFITLLVLSLWTIIALAGIALAVTPPDPLATTAMLQPPANGWTRLLPADITPLDAILLIASGLLSAALVISERLGLNNNTRANGILHYFRIANQALTIMQPSTTVVNQTETTKPAGYGTTTGFVSFRLLQVIALLGLLMLVSGCAATSSQQMRQDVQTAGQIIGIGLDTAMGLCKSGVIPAETCAAISAGDLTFDVIEHAVNGTQ